MPNLGYIGNTDQQWFEFLRTTSPHEEVNFWQPGTPQRFKVIPPGGPFFFRLKAPVRKIGGMGFFSRWDKVPMGIAWDTFGIANGAASLTAWRQAFSGYRERSAAAGTDEVGCILLFNPVFFPAEMWLDEPQGWQSHQPKGVSIDIDSGEGRRIFEGCMARVLALSDGLGPNPSPAVPPLVTLTAQGYGAPYLTKPRLGQGAFRFAVTDAYDRACAVTGEHSLPVLDAAHIRRYSSEAVHAVPNGLLLRADVHKLFDAGYVTVTPEYDFVVSKYLKEQYANGKIYYERQGKIFVPKREENRPDKVALQWHNDFEFEKFAR